MGNILDKAGLQLLVGKIKAAISSTSAPLQENITWAELKAKRGDSNLVPGLTYRIIDYVTTTVQENTQSAGHQFDVLVVATGNNALSEDAHAIMHENDAYFANSNLSAWKLRYCLDNDTTRFAWADSTNGKGVIYRMIDEWDNDIPYDFKNIQFKRWYANKTPWRGNSATITFVNASSLSTSKILTQYIAFAQSGLWETATFTPKWVFTFNRYLSKDLSTPVDASILSSSIPEGVSQQDTLPLRNKIGAYYKASLQYLNNISFMRYDVGALNSSELFFNVADNCFDFNCWDFTIGCSCLRNKFGENCHSVTVFNSCSDLSIQPGCYDLLFKYTSGFSCGKGSNSLFISSYLGRVGRVCSNIRLNGVSQPWIGDILENALIESQCENFTIGDNCGDIYISATSSNFSIGNSCNHIVTGTITAYTSAVFTYSLKSGISGFSIDKLNSNMGLVVSPKNSLRIDIKTGVGKKSGTEYVNLVINTSDYLEDSTCVVGKNSAGEVKIYCLEDLIN